MNGKFILLFVICVNIMTLLMGYSCIEMSEATGGNACNIGNNVVLRLFVTNETLANKLDAETQSGVGFTDELNNAAEGFDKQAAGQSSDPLATGFSFLDGLKMALGIVTLLTPIPIASFLFGIGLPWFIALILALIPIILYMVALAEFVRGGQF